MVTMQFVRLLITKRRANASQDIREIQRKVVRRLTIASLILVQSEQNVEILADRIDVRVQLEPLVSHGKKVVVNQLSVKQIAIVQSMLNVVSLKANQSVKMFAKDEHAVLMLNVQVKITKHNVSAELDSQEMPTRNAIQYQFHARGLLTVHKTHIVTTGFANVSTKVATKSFILFLHFFFRFYFFLESSCNFF